MTPIKILILTANPNIQGHAPLRLGAEVRQVEEALQRSQYRDRFQLTTKLAVRTKDLRRALVVDPQPQIVHFSGHGAGEQGLEPERKVVDPQPQIVHFSGHGTGEQGLVLETEAGKMECISTEDLTRLFGAFENGAIECVLLNACYSEEQAIAIHQFVDCVIGMNRPIGDKAAMQFSEAFYDALGAGRFYDEAFKIGCSAIRISDASIPVLKYRKRRAVVSLAEPAPAEAILPEPVSASPSQSQSIGTVTISGSHNPFNAIQAGGDITINQTQGQTKVTHPELQAVIEALGQLKQAVASTDEIDETEKAMAAIPIQKLEAELQKPHPDKTVIDKSITTLKKILDGVVTLAEPVTNVTNLVAKAWAGFA